MRYKVEVHPVVFHFAFPAETSRGVLTQKTSWLISLEKGGITGWGECAPIAGLSPEPLEIIEAKISTVLERWKEDPGAILDPESDWADEFTRWPSLRFALETAWLDYLNGGQYKIFNNGFFSGETRIPINGLVWMNSIEHMQDQVEKKITEGYRCIKLKIGKHDFQSELNLIKGLRERFSEKELTIRVDANGAYASDRVYSVLEALSKQKVHSIEQPLASGSVKQLQALCREKILPIALDEELILHTFLEEKEALLDAIAPDYLVLKPSLHGGIKGCREWIALAEKKGTDWWMTSYLESSVGLNAIAQFVCEYPLAGFQGLGTGKIYTNNISSPLKVSGGDLWYDVSGQWAVDSRQ